VSRNTLADACPGDQVRIVDLSELSEPTRNRLLALGLCPGRYIEVIRHSPVTLVRVEHSELALEIETARGVQIEMDIPQKSIPESSYPDPTD
jgi:Fe2+ transport system protein FeoA